MKFSSSFVEIRHADGEALVLQADISNPEQVKQMFEKTIEAYGHIGLDGIVCDLTNRLW